MRPNLISTNEAIDIAKSIEKGQPYSYVIAGKILARFVREQTLNRSWTPKEFGPTVSPGMVEKGGAEQGNR
jgi:hypothetical protein